MTPDEYHAEVLPRIVAPWNDGGCRCASPVFRKLLAFDFHDYGDSPMMLADTEILIGGLICDRFGKLGEGSGESWAWTTRWRCPSCGAVAVVTNEEYSINMYPSRARFEDGPDPAPQADYLVGFRYFTNEGMPTITDYRETEDVEGYLSALG